MHAAPIVTLPLNISSNTDVVGRVFADTERVRLFWRRGYGFHDTITARLEAHSSEWTLVNREVSFNATSLAQGLVLAVDGREPVTDDLVWDGERQGVL